MPDFDFAKNPAEAEKFLDKYQDHANKLAELQQEYNDLLQESIAPTSGSPDAYVKAYAELNNKRLEKHEQIQAQMRYMRADLGDYVPGSSMVGTIGQTNDFLVQVDIAKKNAVQAAQDNLNAGRVDPSRAANLQKNIDFARGTDGARKTNWRGAEQVEPDALSRNHANMWDAIYAHDTAYAERHHRVALEGEGRDSAYDITTRWGYNFQHKELRVNTEEIGIKSEITGIAGYWDRWKRRPLPLTLGGMTLLGRFHVKRLEFTYKDHNGKDAQLVDSTGKKIYGPAYNLNIRQISIYGGYGAMAKWFYKSNDHARVMQIGHAMGAMLSSAVNNPALLINLEEEKKRIDPNSPPNAPEKGKISQAQYDALEKAHEEAKEYLDDFRENGISIDKLAPGYGGLDSYYQMQAICGLMGIPFNPPDPTELLQKRADDPNQPFHLRGAATYALQQHGVRGVSMQKAAMAKAVEFTKTTKEYKMLRDAVVAVKLDDLMKNYASMPPGSAEYKTYQKYEAFNKNFKDNLYQNDRKAYNRIYDKDGNIKNKAEYDKVYTKALRKKFGDEFDAIVKDIESDPNSPLMQELLKNGAGAHFTGEEDWYRRAGAMNKVETELEDEAEPGAETDMEEDGDAKPTPPAPGAKPTTPHAAVVGRGGPRAITVARGSGGADPTVTISRAPDPKTGKTLPVVPVRVGRGTHKDTVQADETSVKKLYLTAQQAKKNPPNPPPPPAATQKKLDFVASVKSKNGATAADEAKAQQQQQEQKKGPGLNNNGR